ncbi:MAG: phytoene desaturase [Anaerolineae bacterium]|nr:phytoene desaturase [Anaerolineae bacterium]
MKSASIVVIGAGIGGISAATHLAKRGMHVTMLEKNNNPGGRCDTFEREGHRFNTGPTLLVMPHLYETEFAALGEDVHDLLDMERIDPTYHLVFDDASQLALTSDLASMSRQLEAMEPGSFRGFLRYIEEGQRHYNVGVERLVERDFRSLFDFINLRNMPLAYSLKPLVPHYRHMGQFFKGSRLKSAFTFQDVYMGLSPFRAPATFSLMPYSELAHGVWHPRGGMYGVIDGLMAMARGENVEFEFGASVDKIEVDGSRTRGVRLADGRFVPADIVIANADLPYVYNDLLPDKGPAERMAHKQFSCSVISFFWGVDKAYPAIKPHTLFLADDYRENFVAIDDQHSIPDNPSLYIHAPSRIDASMAPAGEDTLIAIVPVGHMDDGSEQDWTAIRDKAREAVYRRLKLIGITDLDQHLKFEVNYTPLSWRKRYNLMKGATHGLAHTLTQLAYFRPHNRHARYRNLYFTGASTHPGTGVPSALISGRLVAERVMDDLRG